MTKKGKKIIIDSRYSCIKIQKEYEIMKTLTMCYRKTQNIFEIKRRIVINISVLPLRSSLDKPQKYISTRKSTRLATKTSITIYKSEGEGMKVHGKTNKKN